MFVETPFKQKQKNEIFAETRINPEEARGNDLAQTIEKMLKNPDLSDDEKQAISHFGKLVDIVYSQNDKSPVKASLLYEFTDNLYTKYITPLTGLNDLNRLEIENAFKKDRFTINTD